MTRVIDAQFKLQHANPSPRGFFASSAYHELILLKHLKKLEMITKQITFHTGPSFFHCSQISSMSFSFELQHNLKKGAEKIKNLKEAAVFMVCVYSAQGCLL